MKPLSTAPAFTTLPDMESLYLSLFSWGLLPGTNPFGFSSHDKD